MCLSPCTQVYHARVQLINRSASMCPIRMLGTPQKVRGLSRMERCALQCHCTTGGRLVDGEGRCGKTTSCRPVPGQQTQEYPHWLHFTSCKPHKQAVDVLQLDLPSRGPLASGASTTMRVTFAAKVCVSCVHGLAFLHVLL